MSNLARDNRNREVGLIKMAQKQLGMEDADYREMLWTQARVKSATELDHVGRRQVLDYLKQLGFKPVPSKKRPARPTPARDKVALCKRIRAQLISLGNLPDTYADGIAKQMFGVTWFEWCDHEQLHAITSALGYKQEREGAATTSRPASLSRTRRVMTS